MPGLPRHGGTSRRRHQLVRRRNKPEDVERGAIEYNYSKQPLTELEAPGVSVFLREGDDVLHTYSTYGRGLDILMSTYNYLDLTPLRRNEKDLAHTMSWLRHHDRYPDSA